MPAVSDTTTNPVKEINRQVGGRLRRAFRDIRLQQLKDSDQIAENTRRIDALHNILSNHAHRLAINSEDLALGDASARPLEVRKRVPKNDGVLKKIFSSIKGFGKSIYNIFSKSDDERRKKDLKSYFAVVDTALNSISKDEKSDFNSYTFAADSDVTLDYVEPDPESNDYKLLMEMAIDDVLAKSPKLDMDSKAVKNFMQRLAVLFTDSLFHESKFNIDTSNEGYHLVKQATLRKTGMQVDDEKFNEAISKNTDSIRSATTKMIYAVVEHSKEQCEDSGKPFKPVLKQELEALDDYFNEIHVDMSLKHSAEKRKTGHPENKVPEDFVAAKIDDPNLLIDLPYKADDFESAMLDHADAFNAEARGEGQIRDFREYFHESNKTLREMIELEPNSIIDKALVKVKNTGIHGSLRINRKKSKDDPDADAGRDVIENQAGDAFEKNFAKAISRIVAVISFRALSESKAVELAHNAFIKEGEINDRNEYLRLRIPDLLENPSSDNSKALFQAAAPEIINLVVFDNMVINNDGKIAGFEMEPVRALVKAAREIQGIKLLEKKSD